MKHHSDDDNALIEDFRAAGGERIIFFKHGRPRLSRKEVEALSRLVRSGHIVRCGSGDFGWASYRLREQGASVAAEQLSDAKPDVVPTFEELK